MPAPTTTSAPTPIPMVQGAPVSARASAARDDGFGRQLETARRQSTSAEPMPERHASQPAAATDTASAPPAAGEIALPADGTPDRGQPLPSPAQQAAAQLPISPLQANAADACILRMGEATPEVAPSSAPGADDVHLARDDEGTFTVSPGAVPPDVLPLVGVVPQLAGQPTASSEGATLAAASTTGMASSLVGHPIPALTSAGLATTPAVEMLGQTPPSDATPAVAGQASEAFGRLLNTAMPAGVGGQAGHGLPGMPAPAPAPAAQPATSPVVPPQVAAALAPPPAAVVQMLSVDLSTARHAHDDTDRSPLTAVMSTGMTPAPAAASALPPVILAAPAGTPAFGAELGQQIAWFANHDVQHARIRLHPDELGMVDLQISVHRGAVDVSFAAQQPGAVQALQQSLPQLGQMLAQQGLALGHSEVSQHGREGAPGQQHGRGTAGNGEVEEVSALGALSHVRAVNLLDAFA